MLRGICVLAMLAGFLLFAGGKLKRLQKIGETDPQEMHEQTLMELKAIFKTVMKVAGMELTILGAGKVPEDQAVLYVGNHRSYFDIVAGYMAVPHRTGYIAKTEILKVPLLGGWMNAAGCFFLDRKNLKAGLKTILQAIQSVKDGTSVWVFPEGTRNKNEDYTELLPFKEGSLKVAEKTGCLVVPVAITGTADIYENHRPFVRPSKVTLEFGDPFYIKDLPEEQRKMSGSYTRERIIELLLQEKARREQKGQEER